MTAFLPTLSQLCSIMATALSLLGVAGLGRWMTGGRLPLEVTLLAGAGAMVAALTLWGMWLPWPLYVVVILLLPFAAAGWFGMPAWLRPWSGAGNPRMNMRTRPWQGYLDRPAPRTDEWQPLLRTLIVGAPFLLLLLSLDIWGDDSFAFWLPNLEFLTRHGALPSAGNYPLQSFFPAIPYGLPLLAYPATLLGAGDTVFLHLNLIFCVLIASLFARLTAALPEFPALSGKPLWRHHLVAWITVIWLNPGFVPPIWFSATADLATSFALLVWFLLTAAPRRTREEILIASLTLILLVTLKQPNFALLLLLMPVFAAGQWLSGAPFKLSWRETSILFLPALLLAAGWEAYLQHEALAALRHHLLPTQQWRGDAWAVLREMLDVMTHKGGQAGLYLILTALAVHGIWCRRRDGQTRWAGMFVLLLAGYSAFLFIIYLTYFVEGKAPSFWRYQTQLSLVGIAGLLPLAHLLNAKISSRHTSIMWMMLAIAWCVTPWIFRQHLRHDIRPPAADIRAIGAEAARRIPADAALQIQGYGPNAGSYFHTLRGSIWRTRPDHIIPQAMPGNAKSLPGEYRLVFCAAENTAEANARHDILLLEETMIGETKLVKRWPQPAGMRCE